MRNRWYHPELGRFMSADPIGYQGGMNLYAYTSNDPLNRWDPWGLCGADICVMAERRPRLFTEQIQIHNWFNRIRHTFEDIGFLYPEIVVTASGRSEGASSGGGFWASATGTQNSTLPPDYPEPNIENIYGTLVCAIPPVGLEVGYEAIFGGGGGGSVGLSFDLPNGRLSFIHSEHNSVGLSRGLFGNFILNAPSGNTSNATFSGSAGHTIIAGYSRNLEGTNPGDRSAIVGIASPVPSVRGGLGTSGSSTIFENGTDFCN